MAKTKSACGAASLVAAIYGVDADSVKCELGLPTQKALKEYREYQKLLKSKGSPLWGKRLTLACFQCGETFERSVLEVIYHINKRGRQRFFCNQDCRDDCLGTYSRGRRKFNRRTIWTLHLLTGYGAYILSRLSGVPEATVHNYLRELRLRIGEEVIGTVSQY